MSAPCAKTAVLLLGLFLFCNSSALPAGGQAFSWVPSKAAAERCDSKLNSLEAFAVRRKPGQKQVTRFSEDEVNSYLALDLSPKYNPCLKSLRMTFEEERLEAVAGIDFDRLGTASTKFLPKVIGLILSGTHNISARGQLLSKNGNANFLLEQARFDNSTIPRSLVEEIITTVGRKQDPPFDPMQPSKMPYEIQKVDVHPGSIVVYQ